MKRRGKILALLMLLIYMTASAGSSAAALLCRHHCHHIHHSEHHSEECVCEGYSFEMPCDGHHHVQYAGVADRIEDSRQTQLLSFTVIPVIASGAADEIVCPAVDDTGRCTLVDTPPLCKAHCRASALRAPPAWV